jgi:hypothetical protein
MHARQNVRDVPILRDAGKLSPRLLLSSFPGLLRDPASAENADKTSTKRRQKRECEFFSSSATATYNFQAIKCLHFPATESPLSLGERVGVRDRLVHLCAHAIRVNSRPFVVATKNRTKPKRFRTKMRRNTVHTPPLGRDVAAVPAQPKSNKTERFQILPELDHVVPTTYDDQAPSRSIFNLSLFASWRLCCWSLVLIGVHSWWVSKMSTK